MPRKPGDSKSKLDATHWDWEEAYGVRRYLAERLAEQEARRCWCGKVGCDCTTVAEDRGQWVWAHRDAPKPDQPD